MKRLADPSRSLTVSRAGREESGFARELLPWRRQLSRSSLQDHDSRAPNDLDHDHCRRRRLGQPRRTFPSLASADLANLSRQQSQKLLRPEHRQNSHTSQYKSDSKEESQGNGTTLGANSSVYVPSLGFLLSRADLQPLCRTGFTKTRTGAKAAYGGTLGGGLNGKVAVTSKQESRMGYRRNNFTT